MSHGLIYPQAVLLVVCPLVIPLTAPLGTWCVLVSNPSPCLRFCSVFQAVGCACPLESPPSQGCE